MSQRGTIRGASSISLLKKDKCSTCMLGEMHRHRSNMAKCRSTQQVSQTLNFVHTEEFGPIVTVSTCGTEYFKVFIVDSYNWITTFPIQLNTNVKACNMNFEKWQRGTLNDIFKLYRATEGEDSSRHSFKNSSVVLKLKRRSHFLFPASERPGQTYESDTAGLSQVDPPAKNCLKICLDRSTSTVSTAKS